MRVLRDVVVNRTNTDELMVVSHVPGVVGERMSVDLLGGGARLRLRVTVLDSRPLIIDGSLRHRLMLAVQQTEAPVALPADPDAPSQAN